MKYIFKFPDIGEGLDEGKIIEWYVKKGQKIEAGDALVKMETDKVVTDIPSPKSGILAAIYGQVGETIHVGNALVEIDIPGVDGEAAVAEAKDIPTAPSTQQVEETGFGVVGTLEVAGDGAYMPSSEEGNPSQTAIETKTKKVLATPVARAMAKERGIDINQVVGTGPAGRIMKKDIEAHRVGPKASHEETKSTEMTKSATQIVYQPLTTIRKAIARNMSRSKQNAAHMTVMDEIEVSQLVALRNRYKEEFEKKGAKLSYLPFILKAVTRALQTNLSLNSELDLEKERIIEKHYFNIGIAVDTEEGLVVPVIREVDKKSVFQLAQELNEIAAKARDRKLSLDDMKDGTFTITNYGSLGGYFGVPVINYPQSGIMGVGRIDEKPVVRDGKIEIGKLMALSLSVDHRLIDGGTVVRFMKEVMGYLQDPVSLILY